MNKDREREKEKERVYLIKATEDAFREKIEGRRGRKREEERGRERELSDYLID